MYLCYLLQQVDDSEEEKGVVVLRQYEDLEWLSHCLIAHNNVDGVVVSLLTFNSQVESVILFTVNHTILIM